MKGLFLAMALLIAGCMPRTQPPPHLVLDGWVGRPISEVIATWGEPTATTGSAAGTRYTWLATRYSGRSLPVNRSPSGGPDDAADLAAWRCRAVFDPAADGSITTAAWRGEECGMRD